MATRAELGMAHLRVVVPVDRAEETVTRLLVAPSVTNIVHLRGAARQPVGDVILCDVAREAASLILTELRNLGIEQSGSIAVETIDLAISDVASEVERLSPGSPGEAVVWEEVEARTLESTALSYSFLIFMAAATAIAGIGILTDSLVLIIGAMILGPEFGPLAGICVAAVERRRDLVWRSLLALIAGFPVAITFTWLGALVLRAFDVAPGEFTAADRNLTLFISHPDIYSVLVAALAGVAGMISLTTSKSAALVGVLISVTTIPAAANIAIAAAYGDGNEWIGAQLQLALNVGTIVTAGIATLALQRLTFERRRRSSRLPRARGSFAAK